MKGNKVYVDLGTIFDEIFEAARDFGEDMRDNFHQYGNQFEKRGPFGERGPFGNANDEPVDYYPSYSYPPMNVYMLADRSLIFEFALSGFDEKDIFLSFQGDYMVFSAKMSLEVPAEDGVRYFKRRLKLKDIEKQKYYVPMDKYMQDKVKAVFKNGILRVVVPPKEESFTPEGIKIEILKEGE